MLHAAIAKRPGGLPVCSVLRLFWVITLNTETWSVCFSINASGF